MNPVMVALVERGLTIAEAELKCRVYTANAWIENIKLDKLAKVIVDGVDAFTMEDFDDAIDGMELNTIIETIAL